MPDVVVVVVPSNFLLVFQHLTYTYQRQRRCAYQTETGGSGFHVFTVPRVEKPKRKKKGKKTPHPQSNRLTRDEQATLNVLIAATAACTTSRLATVVDQ